MNTCRALVEGLRASPNPSDATKELIASREKDFLFQASMDFMAQGALLLGADGGFILWEENRNPQKRSFNASAVFRRSRVLIQFERNTTGVFAEGAWEDTKRLLNLLSQRVAALSGVATTRTELRLDSEHALQKACRPKTARLPPEKKP
jgi:hypothetical protein